VPVGVGESPSIGYPLCPATGAAPPPSGRAFSQVYASPRVVKRMECGGLWPVRVLALSRDVTATTPSGSGFHAFARIVVADCGWHGSRESSLFPHAASLALVARLSRTLTRGACPSMTAAKPPTPSTSATRPVPSILTITP
jgi:hypothetical protein